MKKAFKCFVVGAMALSLTACGGTDSSASKEEVQLGELERKSQYGVVKGTENEGVEVYYGIPYGADPVGALRWSEPTTPEAWEGVRDCSEQEEIAMQMASSRDADGKTTVALKGTTDCLNLDVYTTKDAEKRPVIVYFHGGNNQTGSSFEIAGNQIVENEGAVYVSVNYRLSLLGFNCLPALTKDGKSGNFALYDMAASLKWIRDNIEGFGGDPANVTISGFSAGGRDVMAMLVSPIFEGLFDKAIVYSGGMTIADEEASAYQIANIMAPLVIEDGKADDEASAVEYLMQDTDDVREYLYSLSEDRIISLLGDAGIRMAKFPHLYGDGITLPKDGYENAKYVNDVPVVMLTGDTEFSMFGSFDAYLYTLGEDEANAREFVVKYGSDFYRTFNTQLSAEKMAKDGYKSAMYLVQVNYGGESSSSAIPMFGAFHGIFVPMLATTNNYSGLYDFTQSGYQEMATIYNAYIKNFIEAGDPNGSETSVEWKPWTDSDKSTLVLDASEEDGKATAVVEDVFKTNAEVIDEIEADETVKPEIKENLIKTILNGRWFSKDLDDHFGTPSLWK